MFVSASEILMGRDKDAPLNEEQWRNLVDLLPRINFIRFHYSKSLIVSSGYRPPKANQAAGGATNSAHLSLQAVDFRDSDGSFAKWCLQNIALIERAGLFLEDPRWTMKPNGSGYSGWVHLDTKPRTNRIFIPYDPKKVPPTAPNFPGVK